jgi:hypothetical protein
VKFLIDSMLPPQVAEELNATITVQAPDVEPTVLGEGDTLNVGELLPGFAVSVRDIFAHAR